MIRRERPHDMSEVRIVQSEAFGRSVGVVPPEARLVDALRACDGWIPQFSLVAESAGVVVGHVVCTRARIGDWPVLGLGPIAVRTALQRGGVGSALMHAMVGAADATGEPLIGLLGSPQYYARFGFVPAAHLGISPPEPEWGDHFQIRTLAEYRSEIRGPFAYASPFGEIA